MSKAYEDLERARKALQEKREQQRLEQKRRALKMTFDPTPRSDYEHWNEERDRVWYEEVGRHGPTEVDPDPYDDLDMDDYPDTCEYCGEPANEELGELAVYVVSPPAAGYRYTEMFVHEACGSKAAHDQVR